MMCLLWMVALYDVPVVQLALLLGTNLAHIVYLVLARPFVNKINLFFMILVTLSLMLL